MVVFKLDGLDIYFPYDYVYKEQYAYMLELKRALDVTRDLLQLPPQPQEWLQGRRELQLPPQPQGRLQGQRDLQLPPQRQERLQGQPEQQLPPPPQAKTVAGPGQEKDPRGPP